MALEYANIIHAAAKVVYDSANSRYALYGRGFSDITYDDVGELTLTLTDALDPTQRVVLLSTSSVITTDDAAQTASEEGPGTDEDILVNLNNITTAAANAEMTFDIVVLALPAYESTPLYATIGA